MNNKPHARCDIITLSRCGAKTRKGTPCLQPAMKNGRCRLHGGKSTGPRTPEGRARAGNWKHGLYSRAEKERRQLVKQACREAMDSISSIDL